MALDAHGDVHEADCILGSRGGGGGGLHGGPSRGG